MPFDEGSGDSLNYNLMKKLLKQYGFQHSYQYFDLILESVINGQRSQAFEQFQDLKRDDRKEFVKYTLDAIRLNEIDSSDRCKFIDLI